MLCVIRSPDLQDNQLELDDLLHQLQSVLMRSSVKSDDVPLSNSFSGEGVDKQDGDSVVEMAVKSTPCIVASDADVAVRCTEFIKSVVARCVQGSSLPLSLLEQSVRKFLLELHSFLVAQVESQTSDKDSVAIMLSTLKTLVKSGDEVIADEQQMEITALSELIKSLAEREAFGIRPSQTLLLEDTTDVALWRWDVFSTLHFSVPSSLAIIRDVKALRTKYSRTIRALGKLVETVQRNASIEEAKLNPLEEKLMKSIAELEKSKEKRRKDHDVKKEKEREKELRRKEKDDAETQRRAQRKAQQELQDQQAQQRAQEQAEKERQQREKLQKQQNMLKSYLAPMLSPVSHSQSIPQGSSQKSTSAVTNVLDNNSKVQHLNCDQALDDKQRALFVKSLKDGLDLNEIFAQRLQRKFHLDALNSCQPKKRRTIKIAVTVSSPVQTTGFAAEQEEGFCEIRERLVSARMKTLFFHKDNRPAYVGTCSRLSSQISGRAPFRQDNSLLDYEYDSEADWESEEEGDDVLVSGNEDESDDGASGNGDELEYDDMFRHDDDFGSDVDEDGEELRGFQATTERTIVELLGPRFMTMSKENRQELQQLQTLAYEKAAVAKLETDLSTLSSQVQSSSKPTPSFVSMFSDRVVDDDSRRLKNCGVIVFSPSFLRLAIESDSSKEQLDKEDKKSNKKQKTSKVGVADSGKELLSSIPDQTLITANEDKEQKTQLIRGFDEAKVWAI
jgi:hypothetical protein